ncbi:MAG TPA: RNA-binding protein [Candidatus Bathyarchaeia archaeon]|nr:RNA-binding protein [Candidatus Bathyarchaeia archaeon]
MNIYVGNLSFQTTEEGLTQAFQQFGEVSSASIIRDRETGASRGFGFVEMPTKEEADAAISGVQEIDGRPVKVNEARPKEERRPGGGGPGGGGSRGPRRNRW